MEHITTPRDVHTPTTLLALFANAFYLDPADNLLWVKGVYQDRRRQSYNGYYYDRLRDAQSGQIVTLRLPERIKHNLIPNDTYVFKGALEKDARQDGTIELVFVVVELISHESLLAETERPETLVQQKHEIGYQPIDERLTQKLRRGIPPRLAMISGVTSIVMDDVGAALNDTISHYKIHEQRIDIVNQNQIITALQTLDTLAYDAIAIVRGGGPGLEVFDNVAIVQAALMLKTPLITAIGHAQDVTLLEQIADKRLITPTALGNYLLKMAETAQEAAPPALVAATPTSTAPETAPTQNRISYKDVLIVILALIVLYLLFSQGLS